MVRPQLVCRNTTEQDVRGALAEFGVGGKLRAKKGHLLVELEAGDPTDRILMACRRCSYAYLRLAAWERGGGAEGQGHATCVSGPDGQPIEPILLALKGDRANLEHALFVSRRGLATTSVDIVGGSCTVRVERHSFKSFRIAPPDVVLEERFDEPPRSWLAGLERGGGFGGFMPVVRAALRKADCMLCTHCHYAMPREGD